MISSPLFVALGVARGAVGEEGRERESKRAPERGSDERERERETESERERERER